MNNKINKIIEIYNKIKKENIEIQNNNENIDFKKENNNTIDIEEDTNEITICYNIKQKENKIKIFGSDFVKNNKNNCKIIYEDKEYELQEYFDIQK